jgi:hypothetical protein
MTEPNAPGDPITLQPEEPATSEPTLFLEVCAAYNRGGLPRPQPNGPNGRHVLDMKTLLHHPFYWEMLNENETTEVLMELYMTRMRRTQ